MPEDQISTPAPALEDRAVTLMAQITLEPRSFRSLLRQFRDIVEQLFDQKLMVLESKLRSQMDKAGVPGVPADAVPEASAPSSGVEVSESTKVAASQLRSNLSAKKPEPPVLRDGLIDNVTVARLLSISRRTLSRLVEEGAVPEPVRITGKIIRWRAEELREWIENDCPSRQRWEETRKRKQDGLPPSGAKGRR
jgi:predicted DNA-binding transcriptional regulator AlpA